MICNNCHQEFKRKRNTKNKFCSYKCYWESKRGIYPEHTGTIRRDYKCVECGTKLLGRTKRKFDMCNSCFLKIKKSKTLVGRDMKNHSGELHWNWKGGTTRNKHNGGEYNEWRKSVFERDNYTCQECGISGVYLNAHHVKSWAEYPSLRFEISNGITLCEECHAQVDVVFANFQTVRR